MDEMKIEEDIMEKINLLQMDSAKYQLTNTINEKYSHQSLGLDIYTHFTSPIRRYTDIVIHRMLNGDKIVCNKLKEQIDILNNMHKNIQKTNRESQLLQYVYEMDQKGINSLDVEGNIIKIEDNYVMVFVKTIDKIIRCQLYSDQIKHLLTINKTELDIFIKNNINKSSITLNLGDKVKLKVIFALNSTKFYKKIFGQLIEPNIFSLFSLSI